jgi:multisubunit Na+/H+ antiporter MnhB subunit
VSPPGFAARTPDGGMTIFLVFKVVVGYILILNMYPEWEDKWNPTFKWKAIPVLIAFLARRRST